jgi:hypothetical protein
MSATQACVAGLTVHLEPRASPIPAVRRARDTRSRPGPSHLEERGAAIGPLAIGACREQANAV